MSERVARRVDLEFTLFSMDGPAPTTRTKAWFFDLPVARDAEDPWFELLNRIFYDANVSLRRKAPLDETWLGLCTFRVSPVDTGRLLAWNGEKRLALAEEHMPWILVKPVWEPGGCFFVDAEGRYDVLDGNEYTELLVSRALDAGQVDVKGAVAFFTKLLPEDNKAFAREMVIKRSTRVANMEVIRPSPSFRKVPLQKPWASGPLSANDLPA